MEQIRYDIIKHSKMMNLNIQFESLLYVTIDLRGVYEATRTKYL